MIIGNPIIPSSSDPFLSTTGSSSTTAQLSSSLACLPVYLLSETDDSPLHSEAAHKLSCLSNTEITNGDTRREDEHHEDAQNFTSLLDMHGVVRVEVNYLRPIYRTALTSLLSLLSVVLSVVLSVCLFRYDYFVPRGSGWRGSHARLDFGMHGLSDYQSDLSSVHQVLLLAKQKKEVMNQNKTSRLDIHKIDSIIRFIAPYSHLTNCWWWHVERRSSLQSTKSGSTRSLRRIQQLYSYAIILLL